MLKKFLAIVVLSFLLGISNLACSGPHGSQVRITILQMNDVYEMDPVSGGKEGGLARVATLHDQLSKTNPNTIVVLAGDLFSPSALGTAPYESGRLDGKQMVAAMNALGLDYITFGNHEFDIKKRSFYDRLKESEFSWISSNVFDENGKPFPGVADTEMIEIDGIKVGIFSLTIKKNFTNYVSYEDPFEVAQKKVAELKPKMDILIALTHLTIEDDIKLANRFPEIDMIIGGHDHENMQYWRGKNYTPIFKADANARTVYIHNLVYDKGAQKKLLINSKLKQITDSLPDQAKTAKVVEKWRNIGYNSFRKAGFEPAKVVTSTNVELDGLEASVRNVPTKLTELIAQSMLSVSQGAQLSFYNSGSVRIDDVIPAGKITEYDVLRVLPFGGDIVTTKMKGSLLKRTLDQGMANKATGAYLQKGNVTGGDGKPWMVGGNILDEKATYSVATAKFLLTVGDDNLEFLVNNPDVPIIENKGDVRKALITQLEKTFGEGK
ncbi:5'-nucleotidase (EC [Olavius sp. associated proteobacterium Delta 1]|nr:5'-nucleotidase (EC [Olavius sp. associated proteobacterium Delta 1]